MGNHNVYANQQLTNNKVGLCIPTYNAGELFREVLNSINEQSLSLHRKLTIDSSSSDNTPELALQNNFELVKILSSEFDHGATRNLAMSLLSDCDYVIFMTQDVILYNDASLCNLIKPFLKNQDLICAYGKQIPHKNATPLAAHHRSFNYGDEDKIQQKEKIKNYGYKTTFCSDAFAAYRLKPFLEMGGFSNNIIFGEDSEAGARIIMSGKTIYYASSAIALHSHNYSFIDEFKRYFDIGVMNATNSWILKEFNTPNKEGLKFVRSEINYLIRNKHVFWLPVSFLNLSAKYLGYKFGLHYDRLSPVFIQRFTLNKRYWDKIK